MAITMPLSVTRQGTFVTETTESDDVSGTYIRRGDIEIPVVVETNRATELSRVPEVTDLKPTISDLRFTKSTSKEPKLNQSSNSEFFQCVTSLKSANTGDLNSSTRSSDNQSSDVYLTDSSQTSKLDSRNSKVFSKQTRGRLKEDNHRVQLSSNRLKLVRTSKSDLRHKAKTNNNKNVKKNEETKERETSTSLEGHFERSDRNTVHGISEADIQDQYSSDDKLRVPATSSLNTYKGTPKSETGIQNCNDTGQCSSPYTDITNSIEFESSSKYSSLAPSHAIVVTNLGSSGDDTDTATISNSVKHQMSGNSKSETFSESHKNSNRVTLITADTNSVSTSRMASYSRSDYGNESFEEVLKERNAMIKTERIYTKRIRQLEDELKGMVNQCQVLSDENKELRKTLDGIKTEKTSTATLKLKESEAKLKQMDSLLTENEQLKIENEQLKIKNAQLQNKLQETEKQVNSLLRKRSENESKQREMDSSIQDLQTKIKELQSENKALEAKAKSLEYDNKTVTNSLEDKRKEFNELMRVLQAESITEADLKDFKIKFERSQEEINHLKEELECAKKECKNSEKNNSQLQKQLADRDNEVEKMKMEINRKDELIADLRKDVSKTKQQNEKLEDLLKASREMETEAGALKSKISSFKAELDKSLAENHRLTQEKEEMLQTITRLQQEVTDTTETTKESKDYLRKWEQEKDSRTKIEIDMRKKEEEIRLLQMQVKEAEQKISDLNEQIKELEKERIRLGNSSKYELETDNRILRDENMKIRQMLVERNIQLTNTKSEQSTTDSRIQILERKHKNAEDRVQKLSQLLDAVAQDTSQEPGSSEVGHGLSTSVDKPRLPSDSNNNSKRRSVLRADNNQQRSAFKPRGGHLKVVEPQQDVYPSPRTRSNVVKVNSYNTITNGQEESDGSKRSNISFSSNLPLLETKSSLHPRPRDGYFMLYREKLKRVKGSGYY